MNSLLSHPPKVSVIIPNYNHAPFLEKRIESILNQSFQDFELLILDDCSTDFSIEIITKYKNHPKVSHVFLNESNSGSPFGLWQYGIEKAKGEYIWIAESDDWAEDSFLKEVVSTIEKTNAELVHTNSLFFMNNEFKKNDWWDSFKSNNWDADYIKEGKDLLKSYGRFKCPVINVSSAVFKKESIKKPFYPTDYRYCGDWKFWIDVFMSGKVAFVAKPLNIVRIHKLSATQNSTVSTIRKFKENIRVINYTNNLLGFKLSYSEKYEWIIDYWLSIFERDGKYFSRECHQVELPIDFKFVFYKRFTGLVFKRLKRKIKRIVR